jgi:hypothetical protein
MRYYFHALSFDCTENAMTMLEKILGPATVGATDDKFFYLYYQLSEPVPVADEEGLKKVMDIAEYVYKFTGGGARFNPKFCFIDRNTFLQVMGGEQEMHPNKKEFIQKIMSQLPGVPEPLILVRLPGTINVSDNTPEQDAQQTAECLQEPVAIASSDGELLAYHIPEESQ